MARGIHSVEGIGPHYAGILKGIGINTTEQLLQAAASSKGRMDLARRSGISSKQLLRWVNMCDLFRVRGIAGQYAELLEAAGVDTVRELCQRNPDSLAEALARMNAAKRLVRAVPNSKRVGSWIEHARSLKTVVTY